MSAPRLRRNLQVFNHANRDCKLGLRGRVFAAKRFEEVAEMKDALTSAIDLGWVSVSSQLDGLANCTDCLVN